MSRIKEDTGKQIDDNFVPCVTFIPARPGDDTWIVFQYGQPGIAVRYVEIDKNFSRISNRTYLIFLASRIHTYTCKPGYTWR